ncbi:hypothetical protein MCUN1_002584 [Malassezia cuniculi]|uniref:ferric-chelate reductase (NADPH) n=1 Tax=Malassezia cuniculi TaxID=948313 RepID=A0AAF0F002_9BASI|nr:hypothetical protein MCUN1_002584 [Malassezia cuniculi]
MIHGPDSPDAPSRAQKIQAMIGRDNWYEADKYPKIITYVLCAIIGVATISHILLRSREWFPKTWNKIKRNTPFGDRLTALRRGIVYYNPPDIGFIRFPSMGSMIVVFSFCLSVIVWAFSIKPYYRLTHEWGTPPLAVRTGMMGAGLVPFIVCLAVKVNPISVLTGLSHDKLQVFHQWLSRLFLFLSVVHTIPFIYQPNKEGGLKNVHAYFMSDPIYWNGTAALILLIWIVATGTRIFRQMSYEFFVIQHIVTSVGLLACLILHFEDILYSYLWVWAAIAIWAFAITARTCMVIFSSEFVFAKRAELNVQSLACTAGVSLNEEEQRDVELVRISMSTPIRWKPGQHVYMRFPSINALENHPFTIVSLPSRAQSCPSEMTVIVRVFNGMTKRLFQRAKASEEGVCGCEEGQIDGRKREGSLPSQQSNDHVPFSAHTTRILAFVDGPYGRTNDPAIYESATFVAGGSGAGFILPIINDLVRRAKSGKNVLTKRIHFVWAARSSNIINWMMDYFSEVLDSRGGPIDIVISLYSSSPEATVKFEREELNTMVNFGRRPDLPSILAQEFAEASNLGYGSMGVYTSGPRSLTHTVSNSVAAVQWQILKGASGSLKEVKLEAEDGEM